MTIEDKLCNIGIKKILIVDDNYTQAAKEYFKNYSKINIDYATSGSDSIAMIQRAYTIQKYDLILSDMEMEKRDSGIEVSLEAFKHHGFCLIVTGREVTGHGHGPATRIIGPGYDKTVSGAKALSDTWSNIAGEVTTYLSTDGKLFFDSIQRYHKYVGKPSDELKDLIKGCIE